nr:hypothetical protein [Tanacetum cinerariifolium]
MVNTRTDAELAVAVQNALQTLLPHIRAEIREEFRTGSGPSGSGGNPPPIFDVMGCEDAFKTRLAVYKFEGDALAWWKAYKQAKAAGTTEEQAKNFQWGLRKSTLNHLMCIPFTDVAQVANAARNYEILYEWDVDGAERPDKRQKSGDRHQPTTQQSSHMNHSQNNDRHGSDRRGDGDNHCSNNNYSGNNNRNSGNGRDQRNRGQHSNRSANFGFQQSRGPSEGYSYPCGQAGHLQKDCKKNPTASTSGQADKKPGFLANIHDTTFDVPSIHDQPIVSEFPDVFPDELPGIPPVREADEEFFVGYPVSRSGPTWLFDIDTLTKSINYQPVTLGNQSNPIADPQNTNDDATFEVKEPELEVEKSVCEVHVSPSNSAKTKKRIRVSWRSLEESRAQNDQDASVYAIQKTS